MITHNNSWSLGLDRPSFAKAKPTHNKSLDVSRRWLWAKADPFEPSIRRHSPSDPLANSQGKNCTLLFSSLCLPALYLCGRVQSSFHLHQGTALLSWLYRTTYK